MTSSPTTHRPKACLLSCTCSPVTGRFSFGRETPVYMPTGRRPISFRSGSARVHSQRPKAGLFLGVKCSCTCPPAERRFTFGRPCTSPPTEGRFIFGREASVYMSTGRWPVYFRAHIARVHAHWPQAGFFSGAMRPCTCPPATGRFTFVPLCMPTGRFTFGRKAPVYMSTGRRPVSFRVRSARVHAQRLQASLLSGAKRLCPCSPAAGRFTFGR